jgi:hypothetical protein
MQLNRLVSVWNFLKTFGRPLELFEVPSLSEFCGFLSTLTGAPSAATASEAAAKGAEGAGPSAPIRDSSIMTEQEEEWVPPGEAPPNPEDTRREEAQRRWDEMCIALVRAALHDLEVVMNLHGGNAEKYQDLFLRGGSRCHLPLNTMTWPELARLTLIMSIYLECGFQGRTRRLWQL